MLGKKGYVATLRAKSLSKIVNGIEIPEKRTPENDEYIVVGFGIDTNHGELSIGDRVIFTQDNIHTVSVGFNGMEVWFHKIDTAVAVVGHEDAEDISKEDPFVSACEESVVALGDKIAIKREQLNNFYKVGELFVPYERREIGRAHNGTIVSISSKCSEDTGFTSGMHVIYDYNASFGHDDRCDILREENVFCALSESEVKILNSKDAFDGLVK